jgi:hypothetical protein
LFKRRFLVGAALVLGGLMLGTNMQATAIAGLNPISGSLIRMEAGPRPPRLPDSGTLFGAFVALDSDHSGSSELEAQENFEAMVGRTMAVDKEGHAWDEVFPSPYAYWSRDQGRILSFEWNAQLYGGGVIRWDDIASGRYDADIDARAQAIKAYSAPAFFVFHHEPEDEVGQAGSEQDFVNAYRHVVDRFRAKGVTNLSYALVLMASTYRYGEPDLFYPGDSYVDLVGADGYNWHGCPGRDDAWTDFGSIFSDFRDFGVAKDKPLYVAEWGSMEDPDVPGRKADWIDDAAATIKSWPEIKVVAYYHNEGDCEWWVDSSGSSLDAFTRMGTDLYFAPPMLPPMGTKTSAYASVYDFSLGTPVGDLVQGKGVKWLFQGPSNHSLTDNHSMGLFASGTKTAGSTYRFIFQAAGNYNYTCSVHPSMLATIRVPMVVTPGSGGVGTQFTVTWAAAKPPTGFLYDVKIKRPGSGTWETWKDGVTSTTATFVPDSGKGTYTFHSRVRNSASGKASWYSEDITIVVS